MISAAVYHGEINVTTSSQVLPNVPAAIVYLKTPSTNTGKVYVGHNSVGAKDGTTNTLTGYEMSESESFGPLHIKNLNILSVIGTDADDSLTYFIMA